jgi:hypothetical protein
LWTSKHIKFGISGTQNFWAKLKTDLNSDGQIKPKNNVFIKFPQGFSGAKLFDKSPDIFTPVREQFVTQKLSLQGLKEVDVSSLC